MAILCKRLRFKILCKISNQAIQVKFVFSEGEEPEIEASALQKKFVPWKSMFPELEANSETSPSTQLIVVASLIDKLPNLGGMYTVVRYTRLENLEVRTLEPAKVRKSSPPLFIRTICVRSAKGIEISSQ